MLNEDYEDPWMRRVKVQRDDYPNLDILLGGAHGGNSSEVWGSSGEVEVPLRHRLHLNKLEAAAAKLLEVAEAHERESMGDDYPVDDDDEEEWTLLGEFDNLDLDDVAEWAEAHGIPHGAQLHQFWSDAQCDWGITDDPVAESTPGPPIDGAVLHRMANFELPETMGELAELVALFPRDTPLMGQSHTIHFNLMRWHGWLKCVVADDYDVDPYEEEGEGISVQDIAQGPASSE